MWIEIQGAGHPFTPSSKWDEIIPGIAGGALGLAGTLVTIFVGWLKDKDVVTERLQRLDEATKRLAFWDTWLKVVASVDLGADADLEKGRAVNELLRTSNDVQALFRLQDVGADSAYIEKLGRFRRWFLLYLPPDKPTRSMVFRIIFYSYILQALWALHTQIFERFLSDYYYPFTSVNFLGFIGAIVIPILFRLLVVFLEKPKVVRSNS